MRLAALSFVFVLAGCAATPDDLFSPVTRMTLPDGSAGYSILCPSGINFCYSWARKTCGGNYTIQHRTEQAEKSTRAIEFVCA